MPTFTIESKNDGALVRWTCDCCGEVAPLWHRIPEKLEKSMQAHTCRVRTCAPPPVVIDESDPFARC